MSLADDVSAFDSAGGRSAALAVGHDEETIPPSTILGIVGKLSRSIEVSTSAAHALRGKIGAAAPRVDVLLVRLGVERQDVDRDLLRERAKFGEELTEHLVGHGARLVDRDEEFRLITTLHARMDVGIARIDTLDRSGTSTTSDCAYELTKNVSPVDDVAHRLSNLIHKIDRNITPAISLRVGMLRGLLDHCLHLTLDVLPLFLRKFLPLAVIVHGADHVLFTVTFAVKAFTTGLLVLVGLLLDLLKVPFRSLHRRKLLDHLRELHGLLLVLRVFTALRVLRKLAGDDAELGKRTISVEPPTVAVLRRVHDDGVDRTVRRDVPQMRRSAPTAVEVTEHEVVVLVGENASDLPLGQLREEVRVPEERDLVGLLIERHGRGREGLRGDLVDVAAQFRKERRVLQEADQVPVKVEVRDGLVFGLFDHRNTILR